jgi:hypothetical protein
MTSTFRGRNDLLLGALLYNIIFYFNRVEDNLEVAARQYGVRRIDTTTLGYLDLGDGRWGGQSPLAIERKAK